MLIKSDYIRDKLAYIESKVKNDTNQKLYDINKTAEDIFMHILNDVYDWKLVNANDIKANFPAIDLIDTTNEIVIQVTSSIDDSKVTSTIEKFKKFADDNYKNEEYKTYANYQLKMFYIKDKPNKFTKATETKIANQNMSNSDFLGIEDINTKVSANPTIATKVFKTLCELLHDKVCDSDILPNLTTKSSTHDSSFIGREDELKAIDVMLESSDSLLLINGIGGIGKSSLANHYLYTREKEFDYYGFIDGLDSFISEFRNALDLKAERQEELYNEIISKLQGLQGKKLLVIDNVEDIESHKKLIEMLLSLHKYNYKILFTSRREIKNIKSYPLGTLLPADAQKLFLSYFQTDELEKVDKIIDYLGLHTLFIKLVAETIKNEGYLLDDIIEKFENGELSKIEFIDEESGVEVTFNQNLQELFSMQNLKDEYVLLLKRLSVLPSIDIELSFLEEILGKERLQGRLNFLVARGWLIENEGSYKLHQIIKEFVLANYAPSFQDSKNCIDFFNTILSKLTIDKAINNRKYIIYFDSFYKVLEKEKYENEEIAIFLLRFSSLYMIFDMLNNVDILLNKVLKISNKFENKINNKELQTINHLWARYYQKKGKIEKALKFFEKDLVITEKTLGGIYHSDMAVSYTDIGMLYKSIGKYNEALHFIQKSLEIRKIIFGDKHIETALNYSTLAEVYLCFDGNEFYEEALKLNKIALNIFKEKDNNSVHIATIYNELGRSYMLMGDTDMALSSHEKSLKIRKNAWGENSLQVAQSYNNMGDVYWNKRNYEKSLDFFEKDLNICQKILGKNHIDMAISYNNVGTVYLFLGKEGEACKFLRKAILLWETFMENDYKPLNIARENIKRCRKDK